MAEYSSGGSSEQELLFALLREQRRSARYQRIMALALGIVAVLGILLVPVAASLVMRAHAVLGEVEDAAGQAKTSLARIDAVVESVDPEKLASTLEEISEIDIESLNGSIHRLSDILNPLASLFGR